ncbi:cupin [candidate division TA06 bacterium DG_78]|uniref:Cupin n=1 Tax=candidate division TA06 bacterium DG_78 TaxID=1703772 RepID=A0A0S7YGU8_UNCT6|nr:MAG: cupin [candidate division TA06 bacterium DG_78]
MADLVHYQEGAVVSRTVMDKKTGIVTLFAFDKGQGLSEHTAPFDALVHIIDGEAEIIISGQSYKLTQGEIIIMPADEPHALDALQEFKMLLVMIRSRL